VENEVDKEVNDFHGGGLSQALKCLGAP
jgi:hypothetical protein